MKKYLLFLMLLIFGSCHQKTNNMDGNLVVTLKKVTSNCILDLDFSPVIPQLFFYIYFENKSSSNLYIELDELLDRTNTTIEFAMNTTINDKKMFLPLYKNTGSNVFIKGNHSITYVAATYFNDIKTICNSTKSNDICAFLEYLLAGQVSFSYSNHSLRKNLFKKEEMDYQKVTKFESIINKVNYERSTSKAIE